MAAPPSHSTHGGAFFLAPRRRIMFRAEHSNRLPVEESTELAEWAETRLRGNSYLALKNISCEFHDGVLTLRGCLPSYYLKQVAQETVALVAGVEQVVNQIAVVAGGASRN